MTAWLGVQPLWLGVEQLDLWLLSAHVMAAALGRWHSAHLVAVLSPLSG